MLYLRRAHLLSRDHPHPLVLADYIGPGLFYLDRADTRLEPHAIASDLVENEVHDVLEIKRRLGVMYLQTLVAPMILRGNLFQSQRAVVCVDFPTIGPFLGRKIQRLSRSSC